jgi:NAD(P)-dependent dehydrogenase (short-subunit alcohol dehydrogenase family)
MALLTGKVAAVTGASSGIGRAIARALAREGAAVGCFDLRKAARPEGYEEDIDTDTDEAIRADGGESLFVKVDVSRPAELNAAVEQLVSAFGRLDIMVNNAGVWVGPRTILEETEEEYDLTMNVNCKGVWAGSKAAIKQMVAQGEPGRVINVASMAALVALAEEPAYCASKGAVVALTRQLALDYADRRIGVNAICPGFINTALGRPAMGVNPEHELVPWPRLGTVEDIANTVVFLASPASEYITGISVALDGGYTAR